MCQPPFSMPIAVQWHVRGNPQTIACPPGLVTRKSSPKIAASHAIHWSRPPLSPSQSAPMNLMPAGGSVTTASTHASGKPRKTASASPWTRLHRACPDSTRSGVIAP